MRGLLLSGLRNLGAPWCCGLARFGFRVQVNAAWLRRIVGENAPVSLSRRTARLVANAPQTHPFPCELVSREAKINGSGSIDPVLAADRTSPVLCTQMCPGKQAQAGNRRVATVYHSRGFQPTGPWAEFTRRVSDRSSWESIISRNGTANHIALHALPAASHIRYRNWPCGSVTA